MSDSTYFPPDYFPPGYFPPGYFDKIVDGFSGAPASFGGNGLILSFLAGPSFFNERVEPRRVSVDGSFSASPADLSGHIKVEAVTVKAMVEVSTVEPLVIELVDTEDEELLLMLI